tara:strand:- start:348 stop:578 length:231 start_codon:yes stop_codon:yes gene_type:complete
MKNEARDAVMELRETLDDMITYFGVQYPVNERRDARAITSYIDRLAKQIDVLEAIDDNDIMEHAFNDLKQISQEEC